MADEPKSPAVVLDRKEWIAFVADMRKIIRAYESLMMPNSTHAQRGVPRKPPRSGALNLFWLKQKPTAQSPDTFHRLICPHCGADSDTVDKFCRICGRNIYSQ